MKLIYANTQLKNFLVKLGLLIHKLHITQFTEKLDK